MDKKSLVNNQEQTADNEKRAAELLELLLENEKFIKHISAEETRLTYQETKKGWTKKHERIQSI